MGRPSTQVKFNCFYCGEVSSDRPSHYARKVRHFCSQKCYSAYRTEMPPEEHNRYGKGISEEERKLRVKARMILNHYLRDKRIDRPGCEVCGEKSEAHHPDHSKPLEVQWLCFKHHRELHKRIYENPELLTNDK